MTQEQIIENLPYGPGFCFVDEILQVDDLGISGLFTFKRDSFFYEDHFPGNPITPGVILVECMAQIGLVCLGMFLNRKAIDGEEFKAGFAFADADVKFLQAVYPNTQVKVVAEKEYFRFKKLRVQARMEDMSGQTICKGRLSGIMVNS